MPAAGPVRSRRYPRVLPPARASKPIPPQPGGLPISHSVGEDLQLEFVVNVLYRKADAAGAYPDMACDVGYGLLDDPVAGHLNRSREGW